MAQMRNLEGRGGCKGGLDLKTIITMQSWHKCRVLKVAADVKVALTWRKLLCIHGINAGCWRSQWMLRWPWLGENYSAVMA